MAALTLSQTSLLAAQLRDESSALSPSQRAQAVAQMRVLSLDVSQEIGDAQAIDAQSSPDKQQAVMARMQQVLAAIRSISDQYRTP